MPSMQFCTTRWRKALANKNDWTRNCLMKFTKCPKAKRFIQYLKLDFFVLVILRFYSSTVQHIPLHFAKSFIPGKALSYNNLGHNFKASVFHSTCPFIPEKYRETVKLHSNLHLQSQVRFKFWIMRINSFLNPFSTFPCISPKATFRKKSIPINILDTIPNFSFPFR